ncbi:two pore domain potassium channel family protein [Falsibacillus albus]|uniref:Two pore domain potassium channel family protein n=2 Tax=Falsibacillus albus TaxID=2478915 RepID=A0A3L7JNM4_9BACI|nr:two pore domain potassium channel family protein [Falsibacillus albus]
MGAVVLCMILSMRTLFIPSKMKYKHVSFENLILISSIYCTLMIGFGLLYTMLEMKGMHVLSEGVNAGVGGFWQHLCTSFYFSAMTLFSVGYGDVVPIAAGRLLAGIEALIGYTIPAAFVMRTVMDFEKTHK